ncbi:hypothetical protein DPMN_018684 [Dreissena polymorpha]|uniref:Uncharacterized protein n=1 Tax=Dreissena polymorpha TaxID=45954 RepID=A0A9D4S8J4_DREPO|nr:hypothetical protein DPMN_018682 [Dreissena polymorpha]KAH3894525.1 hypothetical protein DPMN_018683 [Dreissena polymorpha]KAH3894526.1 hypothetical protein DPMN_018684 [Dreissena polymorpha]
MSAVLSAGPSPQDTSETGYLYLLYESVKQHCVGSFEKLKYNPNRPAGQSH